MALSFDYYALNVQRLTEEDCGEKRGSKSQRMAKLWQFLKGHPKPAFPEKGAPREIFQKSQKK